LVLGRAQGEGASSGAAFDNEWGLLVTLADGFVVREEFFFDRGEALTAAGLAAQPTSVAE
jgi:ketosteroid isomerase-like protein